MEKVELPKEVARAIDTIKRDLNSEWKKHVLRIATATHCYMSSDAQAPIRKFSDEGGLEELIQALVNGYEVEETPEDIIKHYFDKQYELENKEWNQDKATTAIKYVLETLNIQIEGVNT